MKRSRISLGVDSNAKFLTSSLFDLNSSLSTFPCSLSFLRFFNNLSFFISNYWSSNVEVFCERLNFKAWSSKMKFYSFLIARSADSLVSISTKPKPFDIWLSALRTILTLSIFPFKFEHLNTSSISCSVVLKLRFLIKTVFSLFSLFSPSRSTSDSSSSIWTFLCF